MVHTHLRWLRLLTIGTWIFGAFGATVAGAQTNGCERSIQALVDQANPGATVLVPACVFRETVTITKPLTLLGQPGAEIRGSDVWTDWQPSGSQWASQQVLPTFPIVSLDENACEPGSENRCLLPQQVFIDGAQLELAGRTPIVSPGQFAIDDGGHVILADNPIGHLVEVTTRARWIVTGADGVTLQGLTMRHASNSATAGAVSNDGHSNWTLRDSTISAAHAANVSLDGGANLRVLGNEISNAGLVGLAGSGIDAGGLIQGNRIYDNNRAGFNQNWGAGGLKLTEVRGFVVDENEAFNNNGVGLWCDIGCHDVTFSNNRVHHNEWQGINFEISDGATIRDNATWENGWGKPFWGWGAGIVISSSANADVYRNIAAWNYAGISVVYQNRPESPGPSPAGNYVHDNFIIKKLVGGDYSQTYWYNLSLAWISDGSLPMMFDPTWNNRGLNNHVWYDAPEDTAMRFSWTNQYNRLAVFQDMAGGTGTRYLTDVEKDQILSDAQLPLEPEH